MAAMVERKCMRLPETEGLATQQPRNGGAEGGYKTSIGHKDGYAWEGGF